MAHLHHTFSDQHREEVFAALARAVGGSFINEQGWRGDKVQATSGPWTITLDVCGEPGWKMEQHFTRLRAPYFNRDGFRFHIYHARLRDKVGERLGIHDIHTGNAAFDDAFVVKSNKPEQIKRLLADECVRTHLLKLPEVDLCVHDHEGDLGPAFPPGVDELQFKVPGVVDDVEKLREAFALFADVLRALTTLGSATDKTPGIQL